MSSILSILYTYVNQSLAFVRVFDGDCSGDVFEVFDDEGIEDDDVDVLLSNVFIIDDDEYSLLILNNIANLIVKKYIPY